MKSLLIFKSPTPAQLEAGNYKKKHIRLYGLDVAIENVKGSVRKGVDKGGHAWSIKMSHDYGYIKKTMGVDGDHVDVYVGSDKESQQVFVVHQHKIDKVKKWPADTCAKCGNEPPDCWHDIDEDKVMMCFSSKKAAISAYLSQYDSRLFLGPVTEMSVDEFKEKALATKDKPKLIKSVILSGTSSKREKPALCFDFDKVIHSYPNGWEGENIISGSPVPGAKKMIEVCREHFRVIVNSARCKSEKGRKAIGEWLKDNNIEVDEISEHKPPAVAYIDDLAIPFTGDWDYVQSRLKDLIGTDVT